MYRLVRTKVNEASGLLLCSCHYTVILSDVAKLRKATISFAMSIRLSARMEQLCSHLTDFCEIC
jgi:hypothetical protein